MNIKRHGYNFILDSPYFAFCLNTKDGLKALWWLNKITGRKLNLGKGEEVELTFGMPGTEILKLKLDIAKSPKTGDQPLTKLCLNCTQLK